MKVKFVLLALALCAVTASATPVSVTGAINLDPDEPQYNDFRSAWDWVYTISVTSEYGSIDNIEDVEIMGLTGVEGVSAPLGWWASYTSAGDGLYDVTFTNLFYSQYSYQVDCDKPYNSLFCSANGFQIYSSYDTGGPATYDITIGDPTVASGVVGAPAVPEPASIGLTGLALLALGAFKFRRC